MGQARKRTRKMRGQILSTSTGNSGIVLDENGARYTFVPAEWRGESVYAHPGMVVEFIPQGSMATNIQLAVVQTDNTSAASAEADYNWSDPAARQQTWPDGSDPYGPTNQEDWTQTRQSAYTQPAPRPLYWKDITSIPENLKTKKNWVGWAMIVTGPIGRLMVVPLFFWIPSCLVRFLDRTDRVDGNDRIPARVNRLGIGLVFPHDIRDLLLDEIRRKLHKNAALSARTYDLGLAPQKTKALQHWRLPVSIRRGPKRSRCNSAA